MFCFYLETIGYCLHISFNPDCISFILICGSFILIMSASFLMVSVFFLIVLVLFLFVSALFLIVRFIPDCEVNIQVLSTGKAWMENSGDQATFLKISREVDNAVDFLSLKCREISG